jgi:DNA anti-recombination protein RmuC
METWGSQVNIETLTIAVGAAVPVASVAASWITAHLTGRAAIHQAANDERRTEAEHWDKYTSRLSHDNEDLRERINKLDTEVTGHIERVRRHAAAELEATQKEYDTRLQEANDENASRLRRLERRVSESEIQAKAAEIRAAKAERLYSIAIAYLREIVSLARSGVSGVSLPPIPSDLEPDL